ncbi:zinc ABC transporter substrate-binding protein [Rhodovulum sp. 12E13]|uniref:zinc ABC transporter substrate-binding protein n=1 Tax=Rhodovulum sp. 12E13 TaxID=2203891 RepID=UPI001F1E33D9|nr:zinc ABC transporter substrate-binding protein [Rhodovulum sp. 12E13]
MSVAAIGAAGVARAEVPHVAVDIAPVHSLVAQVMGDLGTPELVLPPGASPHGYALRPSEARALQEADLVVWVGPGLTPWLSSALGALAGDAAVLEAMEAEGVTLLDMRESAVFPGHDHDHGDTHAEAHDHDHDHDHDHEHDHAEADAHDHDHDHEHDHAEAEAHDHGHAEEHAHDHDHGQHDPHVWLHPDNATAIVRAVADALSEIDPDNAAVYAANAGAAAERIGALEAELSTRLAPVQGLPFVVFHDGYQYFEAAFGLEAAGAISMSDARMPSAARLAQVRDRIEELGAACVAAEPQFDPGLVAAVAEGVDVRTAVLDPLGMALEPGAELYGAMMRDLASALVGCGADS